MVGLLRPLGLSFLFPTQTEAEGLPSSHDRVSRLPPRSGLGECSGGCVGGGVSRWRVRRGQAGTDLRPPGLGFLAVRAPAVHAPEQHKATCISHRLLSSPCSLTAQEGGWRSREGTTTAGPGGGHTPSVTALAATGRTVLTP